MTKTNIFKWGNNQAVRLPKKFRLDLKEVEILKRGDEIVIRKIIRNPKGNLLRALKALQSMPADFFADGRMDLPPQKRDGL